MKARFDRSAIAYWDARALHWQVAMPISPGPDDVRFYEGRAAAQGSGLEALLLGVTPAIARMRWPEGTRLTAVDWSMGMIGHVFPRQEAPQRTAVVRADWRELPLAAGRIDFAVGDGCHSAFADLEGPAQLLAEAARVLRPGAELCMRCHRRPDRMASVDELFEALHAGAIEDLDMFRWVLAMALHGESSHGVALASVWRTWRERVPDAAAMKAERGWSDAALANFESWGASASRYVFPRLAELRALARPHFALESVDIPGYDWGEHFPRLVMKRLAG